MCGLSTIDRRDDLLARDPGLHRRRHDPDRVRLRLSSIFPRSRMGLIAPMIGLVATLAPTIGPTVGGYLTDALSWHWLFFINIVPGIAVTIAALTLIDFDKPDWSLFEQFRLDRPAVDGGLPRRARIRAGGGPAQRLVRRRDACCCWPGSRRISAVVFFARVLTARAADRRSARLRQPQFRARQRCSRSCSASASTASPISIRVYLGADPRLQRADDRRDDVRLRRRHVPDRAASPAG